MLEFFENFHFLRPWWLILLVLPFLFWRKLYLPNQTMSSWARTIDKNLLKFLLLKGSSKQRKFVSFLALFGFVGGVFALAGPCWNKMQIPSLSPINPVVVLLDLSTDMNKTDVSPNRLARAKFKIKDLSQMLKNEQSGLIVYTAEPFMITPISDDANLMANLLPEINRSIMPVNGNRLDRAIDYARLKLKNADFSQGNILILSGNVGGNKNDAIQAARKAFADGYLVSVLAIRKGSDASLEDVAKAGGGRYWQLAAGDRDIQSFVKMVEQQDAKLEETDNNRFVWLDYGYYLLIIPLLACLYFFRKGLLALVLLLSFSSQAQAGFFLNNNQEGMQAFNAQDYASAAQKFERSDWKGSSLYKSGNYQGALQEFLKSNDVESVYNQGNALAKSGKIDEAIKKYEEVLAKEPHHEDAQFNLDYLKKQKEQQQQNQNNNNNNKQNNQDNQQGQQSQNGSQNQDKEQSSPQADNGENNAEQNQGNQENQPQPQNSDADNQDGQNNPEGEQQGNPNQEQQSARERPQNQDEPSGGVPQNQQGNKEKSDEQAQAREQQYREIPEDSGGLLRAFIYKEYMKNRYGD